MAHSQTDADSIGTTFVHAVKPNDVHERYVHENENEVSHRLTIKEEPVDNDAYEYCWSRTAVSGTFACKSETSVDDSICVNEGYCSDQPITTNSPASIWLQNLVNRESPPKTESDGKQGLGTASQTLLSLLEKGKESSLKTAINSFETTGTNRNITVPSPVDSSSPTGLSLAALLTRAKKFTPYSSTSTSIQCNSPLQPSPGRVISSGGCKSNPSSVSVSDNIGNETRGLTRLRRLLQGEDITASPLEPFKKKFDNLESARTALKYYINRHKLSTYSKSGESESSSEFVTGDSCVELQLKCIFCNYVRTIEDDSNFILHVFAHANNGELDQFHMVCPQCSIGDLPMTEFVCHTLGHCIDCVPNSSS